MPSPEQEEHSQKAVRRELELGIICDFLEAKLRTDPDFYGSLEIVFQSGKVVHIKETKSHKLAN